MLRSPRSAISFIPTLALVTGLAAAPACGGGGGSSGDDTPTDGVNNHDAGADSGRHDASSGPKDSGSDAKAPVPINDSGTTPSTNPALDPIAGRYLLRWDTFGTATVGTIQIRSRVSLLYVTELVVDGDHLTGTERLCNQVAVQKCLNGCQTASTTVDPRVASDFLSKTQYMRPYTLGDDGKTITGGSLTESFGYDGNGDLPTDDKDTRVWDVDPNKAPREAMLTSLAIKGTPLGDITCDVYGVEKFVSSFSGQLGGSSDQPTFPTMDLMFLDGTEGGQLGTTSIACGGMGNSPTDKATVQLVRYGDKDGDAFWNCYDDDTFDQQVPPTKDAVLDAK